MANHKKHYNWDLIQDYYDEGHSVTECREKFGFARYAWTKAVNRGDLISKSNTIPSHQLTIVGKVHRGTLKRALMREGLLSNNCYICGMEPIWNGKPLVFRLDHINGNRNDNQQENLRLVCPNCDSQLDTFAGRNGKNLYLDVA